MYLVKRIKTGNLDSNAFIISGNQDKSIIIDPGESDAQQIIRYHRDFNLAPEYIILTHEHYDHIAGVPALRNNFNVEVISSAKCATQLVNPKRNLSAYIRSNPIDDVQSDIYCEDINHTLHWNDLKLIFIETPGHTPGSICVFFDGLLFSGDTILNNLKTITNLPLGSKNDLKVSLKKIKKLPGIQTIYPGHGDSFSISSLDLTTVLNE